MADNGHLQDFEAIKTRLEEIVEAVNDESSPLDDALDLYEEAVELGMRVSDVLEDGIDARVPIPCLHRLFRFNGAGHGGVCGLMAESIRGYPSKYSLSVQELHGRHQSAVCLPALRRTDNDSEYHRLRHDHRRYHGALLQERANGMMYLFVILGIFACSCSQILLKNSATREHKSWLASMLNWRVILAYAIFFGSMLINVAAMRHGLNLKELPALEASGYIFVPILSFFFLQEKIGWQEIFAMLLIVGGIIVFYI